MSPRRGVIGARTAREPWWVELPTEELLDVRFCDLGLSLEGTALARRVDKLLRELERAEVLFRPYVWLSTDWFTPDGLTGFAIPFYLAHTRLARLERKYMLEVEGGTHDWCMRLLRHETAHALDNAYRLRRRRVWRETFGSASVPYEETYVASPSSKDYVHNLDHWYSQSHPVEDFAETFAVWLQPRSRWRSRYRGWPALDKLRFVDELMNALRDRQPLLRTREREETLPRLRTTLREHYREKLARYEPHLPSPWDDALRRVFSEAPEDHHEMTASSFLRRWRRKLTRSVAAATGQAPYVVEQVLVELLPRCRKLGLRVRGSEEDALVQSSALLGVLTHGLTRGAAQRYSR